MTVATEGVEQVARVLWESGGDTVVLTGAGISTESGIPDYRGPTGRARPATPMTYQDFVGSAAAQQRYWARSHLGWRTVAGARPNDGHRGVAALQRAGRIGPVITQNVDGLHQSAGAHDVWELHGALDRVVCLDCGELTRRAELEERLSDLNPYLADRIEVDPFAVKPDGDVELSADLVERFTVAACRRCDGRLKPDVVFFGESVPKPLVQRCFDAVERAGALMVLGSSLTVMSGYRFVRRAHRLGLPVVIVNQGPTRGDDEATLRLSEPLGPFLTELGHALCR